MTARNQGAQASSANSFNHSANGPKGTMLELATLTAILLYNATPNQPPRDRSVTDGDNDFDPNEDMEDFKIVQKDHNM